MKEEGATNGFSRAWSARHRLVLRSMLADATAVDVVATAATLGEIIADGLCMLLTTHVQRFSLSATFGVSL